MEVIVIMYVILATVIGSLAKRKNRNSWAWGVIGAFFWSISLIVLCFLDFLCPNCKKPMTNQEWKDKKCPRCGWSESEYSLDENPIVQERLEDELEHQKKTFLVLTILTFAGISLGGLVAYISYKINSTTPSIPTQLDTSQNDTTLFSDLESDDIFPNESLQGQSGLTFKEPTSKESTSKENHSNLNLPELSKPEYVRPYLADNGVPFPLTSSYIDRYPIQMTDGYSNVIVDNSRNNSDVFAKLFTLDIDSPGAVRVFFIRAGEKFKIENINPGNYDIRYLDLDSGAIVRTDPFNLSEVKTFEAVEFSEISLTLYTVSDGNMQVYPISENDFNSIAYISNETNQERSPTVPILNPQLQTPEQIDDFSEDLTNSPNSVPLNSDQIFPVDSCGELNMGQKIWYPVYVNYSEINFEKVRNLYCKDAIRKYREDIGLHSIQVASFTDRQSAIDFANFMKQEMGSGEVGTSIHE